MPAESDFCARRLTAAKKGQRMRRRLLGRATAFGSATAAVQNAIPASEKNKCIVPPKCGKVQKKTLEGDLQGAELQVCCCSLCRAAKRAAVARARLSPPRHLAG